jgi:hypothetical protein
MKEAKPPVVDRIIDYAMMIIPLEELNNGVKLYKAA